MRCWRCATARCCGNTAARRACGAGLLIEQLFSMLLAPSMMLFHSAFVVQTLCGRSVSWNAQERSDRGVTLREAWRRQWWHLLVGVAWGALMWRSRAAVLLVADAGAASA